MLRTAASGKRAYLHVFFSKKGTGRALQMTSLVAPGAQPGWSCGPVGRSAVSLGLRFSTCKMKAPKWPLQAHAFIQHISVLGARDVAVNKSDTNSWLGETEVLLLLLDGSFIQEVWLCPRGVGHRAGHRGNSGGPCTGGTAVRELAVLGRGEVITVKGPHCTMMG